jgi:hypothetical protein
VTSRVPRGSPPTVPGRIEPNEPAALAGKCVIVMAARRLAASTGAKGRRVTPTGALSPAEVPEAASVLGLRVKPPVRRAADVPDVHRAWLMAIATGMVRITSARATAEDDATTTEDQMLTGWLEGLRLICADLSGGQYPETLRWLVLLALEALLEDGPTQAMPRPLGQYTLSSQVEGALRHQDALRMSVEERQRFHWLVSVHRSGGDWKLFGLLADAGAVRGTASAPEVTALGRWLARRLREQAPVQIAPDWPAVAVLTHLQLAGEDADLWRLSRDWRWEREPEDAAKELLCAAVGTDAATRSVAVRLVTQYAQAALPAWNDVLGSDDLGPHARLVLSWWEQGPGPQAGDPWWLGVEWATAALQHAGPDEALSCLADAADPASDDPPGARDLIAALPRSGHPQAAQVAQALTEFLTSSAPRSIEHQLQLTVRLTRWRTATWRRVLLPATDSLGSLSWVISVLFGWDGEHLHVFRVGRVSYADPAFPLEETEDEDDVRLSRLFATGVRKLTYTYDLRVGWEHEIILEKLVPMVAGQPTLRCLAFAGDCPLEYPLLYDEYENVITDPVVTRPFNLDKVNTTLASGHYVVSDFDLDEDEHDEDEHDEDEHDEDEHDEDEHDEDEDA